MFILFTRYKTLIIQNIKKSLRNNIISGGDPTGTGKGGVSIYGECFDDEIHDDLKHTGLYISLLKSKV